MKNVEQLIDMSRKLTGNTRYDSNSGVPQEVFVQYLQNAQDALIKEITNSNSKYFKKKEIVTVVNGQARYDYPTSCIIQHIDNISWTDSLNGNNTYWQPLYKSVEKEAVSITPGYPYSYIPYQDGVYMNPPLQYGFLQFSYLSTVLGAQKKAGKVKSRLIATGNILSSLELDPSEKSYDEKEINSDYFLCVTDKIGNIKASNVPYNSITAGVFNLDSYTLPSGQSIDVGDFILVGRYKTNVPQFPDLCESYLLKHMNYEAKYGDSSNWTDKYFQDLERSFASLLYLFATKSSDITEIPITNIDYLGL